MTVSVETQRSVLYNMLLYADFKISFIQISNYKRILPVLFDTCADKDYKQGLSLNVS